FLETTRTALVDDFTIKTLPLSTLQKYIFFNIQTLFDNFFEPRQTFAIYYLPPFHPLGSGCSYAFIPIHTSTANY
ncbi:MAG: hypothetical protein II001_02965, partial [Bacteroidales bacterium]|nr:hypothetical protein [Bacteroidales bacterium]